jgi:hypothetical protein
MRIVLLLFLLAGCSASQVNQGPSEAEKNAERRHNEMMAEMESAHFDRLEEKLKVLRKEQADMEVRRFESMFEK